MEGEKKGKETEGWFLQHQHHLLVEALLVRSSRLLQDPTAGKISRIRKLAMHNLFYFTFLDS